MVDAVYSDNQSGVCKTTSLTKASQAKEARKCHLHYSLMSTFIHILLYVTFSIYDHQDSKGTGHSGTHKGSGDYVIVSLLDLSAFFSDPRDNYTTFKSTEAIWQENRFALCTFLHYELAMGPPPSSSAWWPRGMAQFVVTPHLTTNSEFHYKEGKDLHGWLSVRISHSPSLLWGGVGEVPSIDKQTKIILFMLAL